MLAYGPPFRKRFAARKPPSGALEGLGVAATGLHWLLDRLGASLL